MLFRPCEILQRRSERFRRHHTQVEFQTGLQPHALFRLAPRENLLHERMGRKAIHHRGGIGCGRQHIEIAARFLATSATARFAHLVHAGHGFQVTNDLIDGGLRLNQQHALPGSFAMGETFQNDLLRLLAKTFQTCHPILFTRGFQIGERLNLQFFDEGRNLFRTDAGDA